jgi:hypothetical protein
MCHASSLSVTLFKSYVAFFITVINEVKVGSGAGPAKVVVVGWDDAAVQERTVLVRSTAVESNMVAGFAAGAAAAWFSEGVVDSKVFMIPGAVRVEYSWGVNG